MTATPLTIDFKNTPVIRQHASGRVRDRGKDPRSRTANGQLLTPKQIRARARRKAAKGKKAMTDLEFNSLYKPVEEWDMEELARGRPKDVNGGWHGPKPKWINREITERAMELFQEAIKSEIGVLGIDALSTMKWVIDSQETDDRGRPLVPATAKLQASHFVLEHIIGKPKQQVSADISVRLQAILGDVMVNATPQVDGSTGDAYGAIEGGYTLAHYPGKTMPLGMADDDDLRDENEGEGVYQDDIVLGEVVE